MQNKHLLLRFQYSVTKKKGMDFDMEEMEKKESKDKKSVIDVWDSLKRDQKKAIYPLIGKAFVTGKRVSVPKEVYTALSKEQKEAVRWILDAAKDMTMLI